MALVFVAVAVLPIKWAAQLLGARRSAISSVLWAMFLSLPLGFIGSEVLGLGILGSYLGFTFAIFLVLRPSLLGSLLIPLVAIVILVVLGQLGESLGLLELSVDAV